MRIKNQAVFFAGLAHLQATPEILMGVLTRANARDLGLLPTMVQEIGSPHPRIKMSSESGSIEVVVSSSRLDIVEQISFFAAEEARPFAAFADFAQACIDVILDGSNIPANRLAFVSAAALDPEPARLANSFDNFLRPLPFYQTVTPSEWTARANGQQAIHFGAHGESCNVITKIDRAQGQATTPERTWASFDRVVSEVDINTLPTAGEPRFAPHSMREFINAAGIVSQLIQDQVSNLVQ